MTDAQIIEQLREVCKKKGYAFFERGDYNLNLIGVRENDAFENTFSDTLYCAYKEKGVWKLITIKWTTLAGTLGIGGEKNPLTGAQTGTGVDGVAVILEGQYRRVYRFIDTYNGWLWYPYFDQIANMKYLRDNDKDGLISRKGKVYEGNYKTNMHRMSNNGVESNQVNFWNVGWSQGCQGAPEPDFRKLLFAVREAVKRFGNVFSYTLLHRNDL